MIQFNTVILCLTLIQPFDLDSKADVFWLHKNGQNLEEVEQTLTIITPAHSLRCPSVIWILTFPFFSENHHITHRFFYSRSFILDIQLCGGSGLRLRYEPLLPSEP